MTISRRDFIGTVLAACLAPEITKIKAPQRWYTHLEWTGLKRSPTSLMLIGQIFGHRNDGEFFYACVPVCLQEAVELNAVDVEMIDKVSYRMANGWVAQSPLEQMVLVKIDGAKSLMESFLDPKCTCSARVIGHKMVHDEEFGDMRVPIHPFCELHTKPEAA